MPEPRPSTTPRGGAVRSLLLGIAVLVLLAAVHLSLGLPASLAVAGLIAVVAGFVALVGGAPTARVVRGRRGAVAVLVIGGAGAFLGGTAFAAPGTPEPPAPSASASPSAAPTTSPLASALAGLRVQAAAPSAGFGAERRFGPAWADVDGNGCSTRDDVLRRDLVRATTTGCGVAAGVLHDPWTGDVVHRASARVARVVSLENAWRTGAQDLPKAVRTAFAEDPANLVAVSRTTSAARGTGSAAVWLPSASGARCAYVAAQIAVKRSYGMWVTRTEHDALAAAVAACPEQVLPTPSRIPTPSVTAPVRGGAACDPLGATAHNGAGAAVVCRQEGSGGPRWRLPA